MMRKLASICIVVGIAALAAGNAHASDDADDPPDDDAASPSRIVPIAMIALGAPALVTGVFGIVFDEDPSPKLGPTHWESGRPGAIAVASGAVFTAVGTYLYFKHAPARQPTSRTWMKWTGIATIGAATLGAGLGVKYALDRRSSDRELYETCMTGCDNEVRRALLDDRKRVSTRASILAGTSTATGVAGIALLLLSREDGGGPQIKVSSTRASLGWATSF
jgi:hypothetical protein